ncbi:unnamed protein product [Didymodactylos carnosus]|uniref:Uncharacterized protein n=1 Tax=Didymodactylos carnosus TaxID=1234261 RepID=A0A8S2DXE6_9BILA|nr:unnamed protein product [Didymodactylos carnosus]CAF3841762.1 unnamed protein product [Didymodactylos carnosus]
MENLEKSNVAFIGKLADAKKEWISSSIPPIDHYILKFDQSNLVTLRGRIYEKMKQFQYQQKGKCTIYPQKK